MKNFKPARIIAVLFIIAIGLILVPKGKAAIDLTLTGIIIIVILIPASIGFALSSFMTKKMNSAFMNLLKPLNPEYMTFYNRLYAVAEYNGFIFSFTSGNGGKALPSLRPGQRNSSVIARCKIPGTSGKKLHLIAIPEYNSGIRKISGWESPEAGFFYSTGIKDHSKSESLSLFMKLSSSTKILMKEMSENSSSCSITTEWQSVMIGREKSLQLYKRNMEVMEQLEFNSWIPLNISDGEFISIINKITEIVKQISIDMKG